MGIENGRPPRPGTLRAAVLIAFKKGEPRTVIEGQGKWSSVVVRTAIKDVADNYVKGEEADQFAQWRRETRGTTRGLAFYQDPEYQEKRRGLRSDVQKELHPLAERGFSAAELRYITGCGKKQARQALRKGRGSTLSKLDSEDARRRKSDGVRVWRMARGDNLSRPMHDLIFAKKLYEAGFVTADLTNWQELHKLYDQHERKLPESSAVKVGLEVFLQAWKGVIRGERDLLSKYTSLGAEIDYDWFMSILRKPEVEFIRSNVVNEQGCGRDRLGPFRLRSNGEKLRTPFT